MNLAILQARFSSKRLPGKVLKPLFGKPMLVHQLERLQNAKHIDHLVVATSLHVSDNPIEELVLQAGFDVYRGDLEDVLSRFCGAAHEYPQASTILRLTADCPLTDWTVIDAAIELYEQGQFDYVSNGQPATWPDGLDVEVIARNALLDAGEHATLLSEREHVTPYIHKHREKYKVGNLINSTDLSALRWTVDEQEDFDFVSEIYQRLFSNNPNFSTQEILALLEAEPNLVRNAHIKRNEGYAKSLARDQKPS